MGAKFWRIESWVWSVVCEGEMSWGRELLKLFQRGKMKIQLTHTWVTCWLFLVVGYPTQGVKNT